MPATRFGSSFRTSRTSGSSRLSLSKSYVGLEPRLPWIACPNGSINLRTAPRRRKRSRVRVLVQWGLLVAALLVLSSAVLGIAFAGSPETLPAGTSISGVDVAGMTPGDARTMLERRSDKLDRVPVTFVSSGKEWQVKPTSLLIETDWAAAVEAARQQGEGFGPFRWHSQARRSRVRERHRPAQPCVRRGARVHDRPLRDGSSIARGPSRSSDCAGSSRWSRPAGLDAFWIVTQRQASSSVRWPGSSGARCSSRSASTGRS